MDSFEIVLESFKKPLQELAATLTPEQIEQLQLGAVPLYATFGVDRLGFVWESKAEGPGQKSRKERQVVSAG